MRAVIVREFGPPEVLVAGEAPEPVAAAGEVIVDVELANITFVETQVRAGRPPHPSMLPALPAILGNGVGGVVAAVGPGVNAELVGRRIVTSLSGSGGYAERAVAAAQRLVEVPDGLAMREAVALLADGRTALSLVRQAQPRPGETVLVEAAAGGVGSLLVQLARNAGARVVAAAAGERKLAVARELGADVAIDYRADDWPQQLRDAVGAVDVVFDGVGGAVGEAAFGLLGPGGRLSSFGMASGSFARIDAQEAEARSVVVLDRGPLSPEELLALTRAALEEGTAGRLRPVIGQELPLEDAAAAHAAIEARATVGKTLLVVEKERSDGPPRP
jgi:NADPH2:quinone reductase